MNHHNTKHGHNRRYKKTPTYKCWANMIQRCTNTNNRQYHDYGGRGISVCSEWNEFEAFLRDMGDIPDGMTIDRIDNNLGYSKDNCKWSSRSEQCANQRLRTNNTSGYIGVKKNYLKWTAFVTWEGIRHHLGSYADAELAALVRDEFVIKHNLPHTLNS